MTIIKTKNQTYRVRIYCPQDVQEALGASYYAKTFKTQREAKSAEKEFEKWLDDYRHNRNKDSFELRGESSFEQFYQDSWLDVYVSGLTSSNPNPPTTVTVGNTKDVFRLHILPMLGRYSLNYLNSNKALVLKLMTQKANTYANFKTLKSYVNSMFDWAEELEYIDHNRIAKSLKRIKATRKNQLKQARKQTDQYLTLVELRDWLQAVETDLADNKLSFQDYLLFQITLMLSDRKSESYALKWCDIDFKHSQIIIGKALNKFGEEKNTKGNKTTLFDISPDFTALLLKWQSLQRQELAQINIVPTSDQYLFTYTDRQGNLNRPVHTDYLNYRMNSIEQRHPNLKHATPHKLRHTGATLARQNGASLEQVSEALTHSDTHITKTYVNTPDHVKKPMGELILERIHKE